MKRTEHSAPVHNIHTPPPWLTGVSPSTQALICIDVYSCEQLWPWPQWQEGKWEPLMFMSSNWHIPINILGLSVGFWNICAFQPQRPIFLQDVSVLPPPHKVSLVLIDRAHAIKVIAVYVSKWQQFPFRSCAPNIIYNFIHLCVNVTSGKVLVIYFYCLIIRWCISPMLECILLR